MKIREMNKNQRELYMMMDQITSEYIGGYENTMLDYPEDSEEYREANEFLTMGHDAMKDFFFCMISADRESAKHLKFAGNEFLLERIERRLLKWGY